ncbi:MAG: glycine cleavage system aminomethyltransferase GcvT [Phycisphaeraceae bacterium]
MLRTPFYDFHVQHGARLVDFAGWEMPIMYRSIISEHQQVRTTGGLFDVSHMGRFKITGRDTRRLIERIATRRVSDMKDFTCRYSLVCNEQGGILDDILIYRFEDDWMLVVNASNREKILAHLQAVAAAEAPKVKIVDQTLTTGMLAIQGPRVIDQIARFSSEVPTLKRYSFCVKNLMIVKFTISRTGYTGEDGVEVIMPAKMPDMVRRMILNSGDEESQQLMLPCGLGARDSLRLEAGMPLYGHELDEQTDPLSAGLGFAVALDKGDDGSGMGPFIGQSALKRIVAEGSRPKLVGLKLEGKRTARQGMAVKKGEVVVGKVTSGCLSPTLGYPIAMAYVDPALAEVDTALAVELSSQQVEAKVVKMPFYKRGK